MDRTRGRGGSCQTIVIHARSGSFCRNKQRDSVCSPFGDTREQVLFDLPVLAAPSFIPPRTLAVGHAPLHSPEEYFIT